MQKIHKSAQSSQEYIITIDGSSQQICIVCMDICSPYTLNLNVYYLKTYFGTLYTILLWYH